MSRCPRRAVAATLGVLALGVGLFVSLTGGSAEAATKLPPVRHVWVIVLENENYADTFASPSADPYLGHTLPSRGALLTQYYGTGHESNDNYLSLISGQPPNPDTQSDCQVFSDFAGAPVTNGIEDGVGCVYPQSIRTVANQLSAHGFNWKAYEEGMGNVRSRDAAACAHPAVNSQDKTQTAVKHDGYATRHNPFVYFASIINHPAYCKRRDVALGSTTGHLPAGALKGQTGLATDLKSIRTTPAYSFITPDLCSDGHDAPCKNRSASSSALTNIDTFLKRWIPLITNSPAYKKDGLIEITFDESDGAQSDSTACCGETAGPSSALPGITGPGGGRIGAVLLSKFIRPGTRTSVKYNHYSSLATIEKLFGLGLLGEARTVTSTFGKDVFSANR